MREHRLVGVGQPGGRRVDAGPGPHPGAGLNPKVPSNRHAFEGYVRRGPAAEVTASIAPVATHGRTGAGVDEVLAALADPTRRDVLDQLSQRGPLTATQLADGAPVSRQAVVKHLATLAAAGLVAGERRGREVRYSVQAGALDDAAAWLADVGAAWDRRLASLRRQFEADG